MKLRHKSKLMIAVSLILVFFSVVMYATNREKVLYLNTDPVWSEVFIDALDHCQNFDPNEPIIIYTHYIEGNTVNRKDNPHGRQDLTYVLTPTGLELHPSIHLFVDEILNYVTNIICDGGPLEYTTLLVLFASVLDHEYLHYEWPYTPGMTAKEKAEHHLKIYRTAYNGMCISIENLKAAGISSETLSSLCKLYDFARSEYQHRVIDWYYDYGAEATEDIGPCDPCENVL